MVDDVGKKYLKFFVENFEERYLLLRGGRRSGKSFAVFKWLYFITSGQERETILVVCSSYPALQNCLMDFTRATGLEVSNSQILGYHTITPSGSMFRFAAFDSFQKAQGTSCTRIVFEEALNIEESIIKTLLMSAEKQAIFIFNPSRTDTLSDYLKPDKSNLLITTYQDNKFLRPEHIAEFLKIKELAEKPNATQLQKYNYRVFCLGEFCSLQGQVFKNVYQCNTEEYESIRAKEWYALDFGFTSDGDETALLGIKLFENKIYCKEYLYSKELTNNKELAFAMVDCGITESDMVFCDAGGLGKQRINALVTADNGSWTEPNIYKGFYCCNALKLTILESLTRVLQYEKIIITNDSENLEKELNTYALNESGKPISKSDHLVSCLRYSVVSAERYMYEY